MANPNSVLTPSDLETIERLAFRGADDIAFAIDRSFERLEEQMDSMESRINSRLADLENMLAARPV